MKRTRWPGWVAAGMIFSLLLTAACARFSPEIPPETGSQLQRDAEQLFLNGEYDEAQREFKRLYDESPQASEHRSQALYGLACSQIVLARSDRELAEGIGKLDKWDEEKGDRFFYENRRLLVLALKVQGDLLTKKNREHQKQAQKKDRLIANQREKIAQLAKTLERLQKQLEELEAIDENFQEKRKTL